MDWLPVDQDGDKWQMRTVVRFRFREMCEISRLLRISQHIKECASRNWSQSSWEAQPVRRLGMAYKADIRLRHRQGFFLSSTFPNKLCGPSSFLLIGTASFAEGNAACKLAVDSLVVSSITHFLSDHTIKEMPVSQEINKQP
jgi:hypothetical protein